MPHQLDEPGLLWKLLTVRLRVTGMVVAGMVVALGDGHPVVLLDGSRSGARVSVGEDDHRLVHPDDLTTMPAAQRLAQPPLSCKGDPAGPGLNRRSMCGWELCMMRGVTTYVAFAVPSSGKSP